MGETYVIRTWMPSKKEISYTDTLWVYDHGEIQGLILKDIVLFLKIESRGYLHNGDIQETGTLTHETPMTCFSIESYPATFTRSSEGLQIWIPSWHLLVTQHALDLPAQSESCPPQEQQQQSPPQQLQQPLSLRQPQQSQPSLPGPAKSPSRQPKPLQRSEHSKKHSEPRPRASPSSNQSFHGRQPRPTQGKPVKRHPPFSARPQTAQSTQPSLPPSSLPQPSPSSQHPQEQS